jgi:hypothetical protein
VREVLLKDKFLTQLAPDTHRKLPNVVAKGERSLDQLVQFVTSVYYKQDLTKKRNKDKKTHQDLIAALREFPTHQEPTPRTCYQSGQEGQLRRECQRWGQPRKHPWPPLGPCPICKGNHWRSKCPHLQIEGGVLPSLD